MALLLQLAVGLAGLSDDAGRTADDCWHVYLDVGTNIGVQIRKLFEPERYPGAERKKLLRSEL